MLRLGHMLCRVWRGLLTMSQPIMIWRDPWQKSAWKHRYLHHPFKYWKWFIMLRRKPTKKRHLSISARRIQVTLYGVGWGINVHVQVYLWPTSTWHGFTSYDASKLSWVGWGGAGWGINVHVQVHPWPTNTWHGFISCDTSGLRWGEVRGKFPYIRVPYSWSCVINCSQL